MTRDARHPNPASPAAGSAEPDSHVIARQRVLKSAERLFREYGYQKTTVADIARDLGMSPANVYRFFESKRAIFEAVAINLLNVVAQALAVIAERPEPAEARLRAFLITHHQLCRQYFVGDARIRDMVAVGINEGWAAIDAFVEHVRQLAERLVRDGVAEGGFHADDPRVASSCVMAGWLRFCHPLVIDDPLVNGPEPEQMADFLISALRSNCS